MGFHRLQEALNTTATPLLQFSTIHALSPCNDNALGEVKPVGNPALFGYTWPMERTPTFTPDIHLAFLRNSITGEMFIAPAVGQNQPQAESNLRETYPSAAYALLALYPAADVQRYLIELNRWPGLPSRVQPKLSDLLASQRIRTQLGGLPSLKRSAQPQTYAAGLTAAQLEQVRTIAKGMPSETQALAARLLVTAEPKRMAQAHAPQPKAAERTALPSTHPFAPRPPAPRATPPLGSLKEALAAMRTMQGLDGTIQQSATAAPKAMPSLQPITRAPIPAQPATSSSLSASALPPSARGTMHEPQAESSSAFAVGKVSAISVLKALRQH